MAMKLVNYIQENGIQTLEELLFMRKNSYILSEKEVQKIVRQTNMLNALIENGVDNWSGYEDAMKSLASED